MLPLKLNRLRMTREIWSFFMGGIMETIYVQIALGAFSTVIGGIISWIGWKIQKAEKAINPTFS